MKTRRRNRPPKTSGWYLFSLSGRKMYDTRASDYKEFNEISDSGRFGFVEKFVNGVKID